MIQNGGRKRSILLLASFFVVAGLVFGGYLLYKNTFKADTYLPPLDTNFIENSGFESDLLNWTLTGPEWQIATDQAHTGEEYTGTKSLKYTNSVPSTVTMPTIYTQSIPVSAVGDVYRISAWIKSENLIDPDKETPGPIIALDYYDQSNNKMPAVGYDNDARWQVGNYLNSNVMLGTRDWTLLSKSVKVPVGVASVKLSIYLKTGASGTVWFDDLSVEVIDGFTFNPVIYYPNYKNTIYPGQPKNLKIGVEMLDTARDPFSSLRFDLSIMDSSSVVKDTVTRPNPATEDFLFNLSDYSPGNYLARIVLTNTATNTVYKTQDLPFTIAPDTVAQPKVFIDEYNRTIVDGKLFFPLGVYSDINHDIPVLDHIAEADSQFNTFLSYDLPFKSIVAQKAILDYADSKGKKAIYSLDNTYDGIYWRNENLRNKPEEGWFGYDNVANGLINSFKDHPALLAWYTNDEKHIPSFLSQIQQRHLYLLANDPNHPTYQVMGWETPSFAPNHAVHSRHVANTDVLGVDTYPVYLSRRLWTNPAVMPSPALEVFGRATAGTKEVTKNNRSIWMVPECFCGPPAYLDSPEGVQSPVCDFSNFPTYAQIINTAYQGLVNGARGLIYWKLDSLLDKDDSQQTEWKIMKNVSLNLDKIKPISLGLDAPADKSITSSSSKVSVLTREVDENNDGIYESIYAMAVNPYNELIASTFTIGTGLKIKDISVGLPGETSTTLPVSDNSFTDNFTPLQTRVYKINLLLPTIPQVISPRSFTYKEKITVSGTKDTTANSIFFNGSAEGVIISGNSWSKELTLASNTKNTFTISAKDTDGLESLPVTISITRRKIADANGDNSVNKFDFSSLMLNWNKQEFANAADFNEDGSVGNIDFSMMMLNWGK